MARHHMVNDVKVMYTQSEEDARDAEEKAVADARPRNDALREIRRLEGTVTPRRIREMTTADGAKWVDDVEKLIAVERGKL
jgi:hypothetical protein